jgi:hypothetical protein
MADGDKDAAHYELRTGCYSLCDGCNLDQGYYMQMEGAPNGTAKDNACHCANGYYLASACQDDADAGHVTPGLRAKNQDCLNVKDHCAAAAGGSSDGTQQGCDVECKDKPHSVYPSQIPSQGDQPPPPHYAYPSQPPPSMDSPLPPPITLSPPPPSPSSARSPLDYGPSWSDRVEGLVRSWPAFPLSGKESELDAFNKLFILQEHNKIRSAAKAFYPDKQPAPMCWDGSVQRTAPPPGSNTKSSYSYATAMTLTTEAGQSSAVDKLMAEGVFSWQPIVDCWAQEGCAATGPTNVQANGDRVSSFYNVVRPQTNAVGCFAGMAPLCGSQQTDGARKAAYVCYYGDVDPAACTSDPMSQDLGDGTVLLPRKALSQDAWMRDDATFHRGFAGTDVCTSHKSQCRLQTSLARLTTAR